MRRRLLMSLLGASGRMMRRDCAGALKCKHGNIDNVNT